jgi:hypothetical protein
LRRAPAEVREQALQLLGHVLHAGRSHDLEGRLRVGDLDVDLLVVERSFAQALAHHLACRVVRRRCGRQPELGAGRRHQDVEDAVLGGIFARARWPRIAFSRSCLTAMSARSRMIVSTSLPT